METENASRLRRKTGQKKDDMTTIPSTTWRMLSGRKGTKELPKGLDSLWDAVGGLGVRLARRRETYLSQARLVLAMESQFSDITDAKLREAAQEMRIIFRTGRDTPEILHRAVAIIREVDWRQLGMRPYLEQVAGALALEAGCIAEMATGEGKTLTATMPATIAGWRGRGCHVITVNDYLARRDAEWNGKVYQFCGLTVAPIDGEMKPPERRAAYGADITYCTNKEVCADFLRDRLTLGRLKDLPSALLGKILHGAGTDRLVMRGLQYAIVDEADSVLIDEAVTPLIISGEAPNDEQVDAYKQAAEMAAELKPFKDYKVEQRYREITLNDAGHDRLEELAEPLGGIWKGARRREELVVQALNARIFYQLGKQYVIDDGKIVIVDEFTGRLMPDRTWRDGLHQAVEAKESVKVNPPKDTYARVSFQRFFRLYRKLCGMTGTAIESTREMWQIYHLPVVTIPTHKPCIRTNPADRIFATETAKYNAIVEEIVRIHATGQPILVGTRSVRSSEQLSELLKLRGMQHEVLNAVRHAEEAHVVAGAGGIGKITVATNMAGRGTDIKLARGVAELGGLHVIACERHESGRVDRQLFGRAGRQGDPGIAQAFVCLEDELLTRHTPRMAVILRRRHADATGDIASPMLRRLFKRAQNRAQRTALQQRKGVLRNDDWLDESLGFAGSET
jgi:preprotein translocase subunit SecA